MAERADRDLAEGILRNIIPFNAGEDVGALQQQGESVVQRLLRQMGILQPPAYTPGLNEPLPYRDPKTGQMVYPQGYRGPR